MKLRNQNRRERRTIQLVQRADGMWGWRLIATNGQVVATDGSQGYVDRSRAAEMAESVTGIRSSS